jgi:hypothetical protein
MTVLSPRRAANRIVRGIRAQPIVSGIALGALAVAVVHPANELAYDLSVAVLAAWVFNLLVVLLPRLRTEELLLSQVYPHLRSIAGAAMSVLNEVSRASGTALTDRTSLTRERVRAMCEGVNVQATRPNAVTLRGNKVARMTWWEYLSEEADRVTRSHERVESAYLFLPADLIALLRELATSGHVQMTARLREMTVNSDNLGTFAETLCEFHQLCARLSTYLDERVKPILPRSADRAE